MARCTAPVRGHKSAAAAANCPACRHRYGGSRSYGGYSSGYSSYASSPSPSYSSRGQSSGRSGSSGRRSKKPRWSAASSGVWYTPEQVLALTPVRENVENLAVTQPDLRDVFLCHAWDDGVCSGWGQNDTLRVFPVSFHYVEHSVFADAKVTCNPTI